MELIGFLDLSLAEGGNERTIQKALTGRRSCVIAYNPPSGFTDSPFETSLDTMERLSLPVMHPASHRAVRSDKVLRYLDVSTAMNRALSVLSNCRVDPSSVLALGANAAKAPLEYTYPINPFYADMERLVSDIAECCRVSCDPSYFGNDYAAVVTGVGDGHDPYFQSHVMECIEAAVKGAKVVAVTRCPNVVYHGRQGAVLSICDKRLNEIYLDFDGCSMDDVMEMAFPAFENPVSSKSPDFIDSWDFTGIGSYIPDVPIASDDKVLDIVGFGTVSVEVSDDSREDVYNRRHCTAPRPESVRRDEL